MIETPFRIQNPSGDTITGDLRFVDDGRLKPLVIVCHGFTAHKNWGPFPHLGRHFASLGFASLVINFSHNGIGEDFTRFTEFEKFSRNTIGKELEDLRVVLDEVEGGRVGGELIDLNRIAIVGHSRGGGVAILHASHDSRVKAVAAWATVATFFRYTLRQRQVWEKEGELPVTIRSMQTRLKYGIEVLRDLEEHRKEYDLIGAVQRLSAPLLLVHGEADVTVKPSESKALFDAADKSTTELVVVPHTGHMFGMKSGSRNLSIELEHITELTATWFHRHL